MNSQITRYTWLILFFAILFITAIAFYWATSGAVGLDRNQPLERRRLDQLLIRAEVLAQFAPDSTLIYLDSAQQIASTLPDSTSLTLDIGLAKATFFVDRAAPDKAIPLLESLHSLATQSSDNEHTAQIALLLGETYIGKHQLTLAKPFLEEAMALLEHSDDSKEIARVLTSKGVCHMRSSEFEVAQSHFLRALEIYDSLQSTGQIALARLNLASNIMEVGGKEEALDQLRKALEAAEEAKDTSLILNVLNDIGIVFRKSDPDSAVGIYRSALAMIPEGRFAEDYNRLRFNLANIISDQGDLRSALDTFQSVYRSCKELGLPMGVVVSCSGISEILEIQGNLPEALKWSEEAIANMRPEPGPSRFLNELLNQKAGLLLKIGRTDQALDLKTKVVSMERELTDGEKKIQLLEMEKAFQYERKVSENENIKANLSFRNRLRLLLLVLFGVVLTLSVILSFLLWQRKMMTVRLERAYHKLIKQYRFQQETPPLGSLQHTTSTEEDTWEGTPEADKSLPADQNLADRLEEWLIKERPFLDPKFRVETACERLQTNAKALAQALRQHRGANFNTLINKARVREAMKLMADPEYDHYKVEFIGYRAGFGTKQTFYTAFEQETGLTPGFYRNSIMDTDPQSEER